MRYLERAWMCRSIYSSVVNMTRQDNAGSRTQALLCLSNVFCWSVAERPLRLHSLPRSSEGVDCVFEWKSQHLQRRGSFSSLEALNLLFQLQFLWLYMSTSYVSSQAMCAVCQGKGAMKTYWLHGVWPAVRRQVNDNPNKVNFEVAAFESLDPWCVTCKWRRSCLLLFHVLL